MPDESAQVKMYLQFPFFFYDSLKKFVSRLSAIVPENQGF